jgi:hypothetical protein
MTGTFVCCLECCPETKNGTVPLPGWNVGVVLLDSYSKRVCSLGQEKWRGPECEVSLQRHRFPGSELARLHDLDRR